MKKILVLLMLILTTAFAYGQESKGILYKATKGDKTVYLFGTINAPEDDVMNLSPDVWDAYEESKGAIFFVSPYDYVQDGGVLKTKGLSSEKISETLPLEKYQLLRDRLTEIDMSPEQMEYYKLWVNHFFLTQREIEYSYDNSSVNGDMIFFLSMKDKKIFGINTPYEGVDKFINICEEEIFRHIETPFEKIKETRNVILKAWKNGDEKTIKENLKDYYTEYNRNYAYEDNKKLVSIIDEEIETLKTMFVSISVEQLLSEISSFEELRKRGYTLERFEY